MFQNNVSLGTCVQLKVYMVVIDGQGFNLITLVLIHCVNLYGSNEKFCILVRVFIVWYSNSVNFLCVVRWFCQTVFREMILIVTTMTRVPKCRTCIFHVSSSRITTWPPISTVRPLISSSLFCMFCMFTIILRADLSSTYWLTYRRHCFSSLPFRDFNCFVLISWALLTSIAFANVKSDSLSKRARHASSWIPHTILSLISPSDKFPNSHGCALVFKSVDRKSVV